MKNPLISVLVPVYMIDRYIGICIESIIHQTFQNLEIILVDDGSRDRCAEICDLYAEKDHRIKVVHKPNGGLVSARKAGLRESNGEYVAYVDGDDWIGPGFIEGLYTAAKTSGADMVCAGFTRDLFSKSVSCTNCLPSGIYRGEGLMELWRKMASMDPFYRPGIGTYVWNKLFRRSILLEPQSCVDNRISIGEDAAVTYPALLRCSCVAVVDNVAYHYRQREDSMLKQSTLYSDEAQKLRFLYDYLIRWTEKTSPDLSIARQIVDYVLSIAIIRSGGRSPQDDYSAFDSSYFGKNVVVYSAGTFGQQLVNRLRETALCNVTAWIDDDYWEYRRCCLNVDPVERIVSMPFDYVLVAAIDRTVAESIERRLLAYGVCSDRILMVTVPENKEETLRRFLDVDSIKAAEERRKHEVLSHA